MGNYTATTGSLAPFNQYGGAGGTGRFLNVSGGPITVDLTPGYEYVGFWWSAGDASNAITFYDDAGNELIQFTTADINTLLSGSGSITAIDNTSYPKADYYGNPNSSPKQNSREPYAYVNLILQNSTVKFGKISITGSNFELDNLALAHPPTTTPGTWVQVKSYPVKLTANNDSYATVAGVSVTGNVADNDPAAADTTATYALAAGPSSGTVTLNATTGAFTYQPTAGFSGTDTFTYTRCRADEPTLCDTATVSMVVIDAVNDSNATQANVVVTGGVASNDNVPSGSFSTSGSTANGGNVTMGTDGQYTYTPATNFSGMDSFTYTTCLPAPNASVCDTATVYVAVRPKAGADSATTPVGAPVGGTLADKSIAATGSTFAVSTGPAHGTVVVNADGSYTYTPDTGYTGTDSFSYQVCLPSPNATLCDTATVNLTVLGATSDSAVTKVDTPVSGTAASNDGTLPAGAVFNKLSDPAHGSVTWNSATGAYTYVPATGYTGTDSFTYSLCSADTPPVCSQATVNLYVLQAVDDSASVTPDTALNGSVAGNDHAPANATYSKLTDPAHGTVTVNADGSYTYTPATGYLGTDSFQYQVCAPSDAGPVCTSATVTVTVANAVPTLSQWGLGLLVGLLAWLGLRRRTI